MDKTFKPKNNWTNSRLWLIISVVLLIAVGYLSLRLSEQVLNNQKQIDASIQMELELVQADLDTYGYSSKYIEIVKNNLLLAHTKFKSQIGMIHGICLTESDYRYWIDHPTVKGKNEVGVGLGGIFWSKWGDKLKAAGIAQARTDLYMPDVSILAISFIVDDIIRTHIKDITKFNVADIVAVNYFGSGTWNGQNAGDYKVKLTKYTSDLWMKRMSVKIYDDYKSLKDSVDRISMPFDVNKEAWGIRDTIEIKKK